MRPETSQQGEEDRPLSIFDIVPDQDEPVVQTSRGPPIPKLFKPKSWKTNDWIHRRAGLGIDHSQVQHLSVPSSSSGTSRALAGPSNTSLESSTTPPSSSTTLTAPSPTFASPPRRVPGPSYLTPHPPRTQLPYLSFGPAIQLTAPAEVPHSTAQQTSELLAAQHLPVHSVAPQPSELPTESENDLDEDENALSRAIAESLRINQNRWTAHGTNLEELRKVIEISKTETRGVYYQLE
jgi:hypothetical protein